MNNIKFGFLFIIPALLLMGLLCVTGCGMIPTQMVTETKTNTIDSATQPFAWGGNFNDFPTSSSFTVPTDKTLVIEYVTAHTQGDINSIYTITLEAFTNGKTVRYILPMDVIAYSGGRIFSGSQMVKIYADPGSKVSFGTIKMVGTTGRTDLSISGYLVDVPTRYLPFPITLTPVK
jgi:hypothetical protein